MSDEQASAVSALLESVAAGDPRAAESLLPLVYDELRVLARDRMKRLAPGQTLEPTALVNEAFIRLVKGGDPGWQSKRHFFCAAALAMRHVLIDKARQKKRLKRQGDRVQIEFLDAIGGRSSGLDAATLLNLDEALTELNRLDPKKAELVHLRYFLGMTVPQIAEAMGMSVSTVERQWTFIKRWLGARLGEHDDRDA